MMILVQDSWGYTVALTTNLDLTGATTIRVHLVPPAPAAPFDKHLTQDDVTTPTVGLVALPIDQGDLAVAGFWEISAHDESAGRSIESATGIFQVVPTTG